jgi:hypothetical protein
MTKFALIALVPLFSGFLYAQDTETKTTTTTTNYSGTLMDAGCVSKHTENKETTTNPDNSTTTKTTTTEEVADCPVSSTTTSFVLETPEHKYIHFDPSSDTRIIETVKGNKAWIKYMSDRQPIKVTVVGEKGDGELVVVKTIE